MKCNSRLSHHLLVIEGASLVIQGDVDEWTIYHLLSSVNFLLYIYDNEILARLLGTMLLYCHIKDYFIIWCHIIWIGLLELQSDQAKITFQILILFLFQKFLLLFHEVFFLLQKNQIFLLGRSWYFNFDKNLFLARVCYYLLVKKMIY